MQAQGSEYKGQRIKKKKEKENVIQSVTVLAIALPLAMEKHRSCSADVLTQHRTSPESCEEEQLRVSDMPDKGGAWGDY